MSMKSSRLLPAASISRSRRTATVMHSVPLRPSDFAHHLVVGVLAGADDQPAGEAVGAESKRIGRIGRDFRGRGHVCGICRVGRARESHAK